MFRVLVQKDGSRRFMLLATFRLQLDAMDYQRRVREANPTWIVEMRDPREQEK